MLTVSNVEMSHHLRDPVLPVRGGGVSDLLQEELPAQAGQGGGGGDGGGVQDSHGEELLSVLGPSGVP